MNCLVNKEKILQDLNGGMKQTDVAKKYNVSNAYITQVIIKKKAEEFDFLKMLIERRAIGIKRNMISEEEFKHLEEI